MLSNSYNLDVTYAQGDGELTVESWFVKVPQSSKTFLLDEMEVFMYDKMLPMLQAFGGKACVDESQIQMPIPLVYHCAFDENNPTVNVLVMENLKDQGYKPLRPETVGLVFMRAAMTRSDKNYILSNSTGSSANLLSACIVFDVYEIIQT